ncbi:uncharacterized protein PHALS_09699 [Plasmopara halstedii]|uniref:ubiquitinyl hydrolase 1 n=1 Tax=Plasmopara halstedii TaxID=4781 RepID=A0A0P1AEK9_PLAHL|nr:uncharacterized protein PHALS_09699 [Plasmopara halstedii]CEG39453.1 hypothetical protein PHALS_09699 [Plasmopara halstedii]|eukprot:XP_024575822.1 hypothetical protein PHALS_09699 [Plasmopara halstedii]
MWSIRIRGPGGKQVVLKVEPETTLKYLSELASKELGLKTKDLLTFCTGFPPKPVKADSLTLVNSVFEPNDTVVVGKTLNTVDDMLPANKSASSAAKITKRFVRPTPKNSDALASKSGVHTLNPSTSAKKKTIPKRKIPGTGHQLGSSLGNSEFEAAELAGENESEPQRKFRRSKTINLTSKEDVEVNLVNAVSGQSRDRAVKFFRAVTRNAVEHQYELTLATARLNAALAHNFETEELLTIRRGDGSAAKLRVRFKETPRKWKEETVDFLKKYELQAILKYVLLSGGETGREMLKPFNMAQVSTRVFWSIAHMYDGNVAEGLADLVPDEDWSFIDIRTRVLSEKATEAKANEEQYKLWKQGKQKKKCASSPSPKMKGAIATERQKNLSVKSCEDENASHEPVVSKWTSSAQTLALTANVATSSSPRTASARAALTRFDRNAQANDVVSVFIKKDTTITDKEIGVEEKVSEYDVEVEEATTVYCDICDKARILSIAEAANAELDKDPWTCLSLVKVGRTASIVTRRELADASVNAIVQFLVDPLDPSAQMVQEKLEKFIDEARLDEINEWMAELVGEFDLVQRSWQFNQCVSRRSQFLANSGQ